LQDRSSCVVRSFAFGFWLFVPLLLLDNSYIDCWFPTCVHHLWSSKVFCTIAWVFLIPLFEIYEVFYVFIKHEVLKHLCVVHLILAFNFQLLDPLLLFESFYIEYQPLVYVHLWSSKVFNSNVWVFLATLLKIYQLFFMYSSGMKFQSI
jgi:hypothetical protein